MHCLIIKTIKDDRLKSISSKVFEDYDEAYSVLRAALKELGLAKGGVFDGQGNIKEMYKYFKDMEYGCKKEDWWSDEYMYPIKYINALVLNEKEKIKSFADTDYMITWKYKKQVFELVYGEEGPENGVVPIIRTNLSAMNRDHTYFYVNDNFGGNGRYEYAVNELYIDLIKAE